ncbi:DUF63 family protein [Halobaculum gomorrense]|uniref:Uncharacterized membrane protein n=1 Tax=Halobaculum gomorrense TaxID=43928 RepID=A0A1M5S7I1_9EURY|nr:DUF63 family protein [Halobaculum gomorrense]SHH34582.1 Uncharacterized membrane protein [Halobaculum gomorrense]
MSSSSLAERLGTSPERAYLAAVLAATLAIVAAALAFPEAVYDGFIWHYFWGPVQADANSAVCAIRPGSTVEYLYSSTECAAAAEPVAYPGYTLVSEAGYVAILLVALAGVVLLLRRLDIARTTDFFLALVPFFVFGGALRVVEDADNAMADALFPYPWNTLLISPIIYFTVFALTLVVVVAVVWLSRRGTLDGIERPILLAGIAFNVVTVGFLVALAATPGNPVTFYPQVIAVILAGTAISTAATWYATKAWIPWVHSGTGTAGVVVLAAHALDGVANVVGLDYMIALGAGPNLVPKHPVNQFIVDAAGAAWPFLVVKLVAAVFVLAVFEEELFAESPRYAVLLLIAVTAVGMGPGTRDMLRATFGI